MDSREAGVARVGERRAPRSARRNEVPCGVDRVRCPHCSLDQPQKLGARQQVDREQPNLLVIDDDGAGLGGLEQWVKLETKQRESPHPVVCSHGHDPLTVEPISAGPRVQPELERWP